MRCSDCHAVIKPVVAVDVDGTLGDYHRHFLVFARHYFGRHDKPIAAFYDGSESFRLWVSEQWDLSDKDWHDVKLAYRQGGMKRTMPIFEGAAELCAEINDEEAELWITTTRPYLSLDNIVPDTVEWCRRHEIAYSGILFDDDKYATLAERVDSRRVVAILDDLPEMVEAATAIFGADVPILCRGTFNRAVRTPLMTDLATAPDIILPRIRDWRERYDDAA